MKKFKRVLVANRGEIAIRIFRACSELDIRSVAIYSEEDKNSLFRTKADESYQIGKNKKPVDAYLGIDEIISIAKSKGVDAIHPGYGLLSENVEFARKCEESGIVFIGPDHIMMDKLGDKIKSKKVAHSVKVPTIPGIEEAVKSEDDARKFADFCGYPVILKASAGGGGRGMRIVWREEDLIREFNSAQSEAKKAFGIDDIFIEKYLERPKHIEVQVLGDNYGNIVHLYERDCSIQRRHQKVIEFTPAICITNEQRQNICEDALEIARSVNYRSAGTVEFLVDKNGNHYFIEMNPRVQVEHTITEMATGIDIVQSQILIAEGHRLDSEEVNIKSQNSIEHRGYAIQCRVTTEDPANNFAPDTGKIDVYRTGSGFGIRLDGDNGFTGAVISPYYDSLLVKVSSWSRSFKDAIGKSSRALREVKILGVKTNIGFLLNVLNHETFRNGQCDTGFIADNPSLLNVRGGEDKELKVLNYIGNIVVNETKGIKQQFDVPRVPQFQKDEIKPGLKQMLDEKGPKEVSNWVLNQKRLLLTDTTMRDAHQSLMATRVRTIDMEKIAPSMSHLANDLFSVEMWGGATYDVSYRFLKEDPWERLKTLREKMPNILFQMLLRGANAVGYKNYPDNVIKEFIKTSSKAGIDVFRIFDSLNWMEGMEIAIDEVLNQNKIVEASICYTGDILDETRDKYSLKYYVDLAKKLEKRGAHILAIKDMSALLKPMAADKLVRALKNELAIPVHLHTHDTSGNGVVTVYSAANAGVDIVDTAFNSMAGLTSQPPLNSIIAALNNSERDTMLSLDNMQQISDYWEAVRPVYQKFESGLKTGTAEIYKYEIPGGQYSNLKPQVESFGLGNKFEEVKEMFKTVNGMLGDIVKVTPSSKAVGDMAIFMVQNDLNSENIYDKARDMDFPDSIVSYFEGMMGQPEGGFPEDLSNLVLKGKEPIKCRPGELLPSEDFEAIKKMLREKHDIDGTDEEALSYALYPKVFEDYLNNLKNDGNLRLMGSDIFFHGLEEGETCEVKIAEGKKLVIKLIEIRNTSDDGTKDLAFEVNGNRRIVTVKDKNAVIQKHIDSEKVMADSGNQYEVGANIPGNIFKILVKEGDKVEAGQPIAVLEAMKMETNVISPLAGTVNKIHVKEGQRVVAGELIAELE
ncbi:pyruvate carboxylase [Sedimentibacter acidaminivorans]|uniref:Pyruvate carboxylase n=1 Tax=Sedimentibacter acidaminivorans TaxID=913099 RepID=A0ABS4GFY2_9FIRM|nr:pyruvate carboxylase [Sedimentibacter acidaminivorans]MBP1926602.1 pyruvate carboxylase [Sedimentibacter acidaminivorans]